MNRSTVLVRSGVVALLVIAIGVVTVTRLTNSAKLTGMADARERLADAEQSGTRIGASAPVRIHVFADPMDQQTIAFTADELQPLTRDLAASKQAVINLNPIPDPDDPVSTGVAKGVLAAARQDRAWMYLQVAQANERPAADDIDEWLLDVARAIDLDASVFARDLRDRDDQFEDAINAGLTYADTRGLQAPLAFHVVGTSADRVISGAQTADQLARVVERVNES